MTPTLDAGLLWVEKRIRELSQELGRPVDAWEWPWEGRPAGPIILKIWRGEAFRSLELAREELL